MELSIKRMTKCRTQWDPTNAYHLGISELHNAHIKIMGNQNDIIDVGVETLEAGW